MESLREALHALWRPQEAFAELGQARFRPGRAFLRMLLWWLPPALALGVLETRSALAVYQAMRAGHLPAWFPTWALPGLDSESAVAFFRGLPAPPGWDRILPALLLLVPLEVVGVWLHDAVWDHTALWMLGGLKARRGFRATMLADSEALRIASLGSWAGLLGFLPRVGSLLSAPLLLLSAYLWIFRGFSLAACHGLPAWKGLAATLLHLVLMGVFVLVLLAMMMALLGLAG
ncbi:MAG TPA: hypothetical protein VF768_00910 [Holophagaceae bacterium]